MLIIACWFDILILKNIELEDKIAITKIIEDYFDHKEIMRNKAYEIKRGGKVRC